jgi:hypothetical protein
MSAMPSTGDSGSVIGHITAGIGNYTVEPELSCECFAWLGGLPGEAAGAKTGTALCAKIYPSSAERLAEPPGL